MDSPGPQEPISDAGDYLIESLNNYYTFGETALTRQDLRKIAAVLANTQNVNFHTSYSLLWLQMLMDYYDYTGDVEFVRELAPQVHGLLDRFTSWRGKNGLISEAPDYMFMDWLELDGFNLHHPPAVIGQGYMTAFYYRALDDAARVATITGDAGRAASYGRLRREVSAAFNRELWVEKAGLYRDGKPFQTSVKPNEWLPADKDIETFTPHVNALAVLYDLAPKARQSAIMEKVMASQPLNCQPYFMNFVLNALAHADLFGKYGTAQMRRWHVFEQTRSFFEMWDHGNLAHAWECTPLFQLSARVLGVTAASPGYTTIAIHPTFCDLKFARGKVPTPQGIVEVAWKLDADSCQMTTTIPAGTKAEITLPPVAAIPSPIITMNGETIWRNGSTRGKVTAHKTDAGVVVTVPAGSYAIQVH